MTPIRPSRDTIGERMLRHGHTCGRKQSPTYVSWYNMLTRCTNANAPQYQRYGGAGITVCERWRDFANFLADMGERPPGKTLDRWPARRGNYEPDNVRWATHPEQCRNRSSSRAVVRSDGKRYPSMGDAATDVGGTKSGIYGTCAGEQHSHRGFGWRYAS